MVRGKGGMLWKDLNMRNKKGTWVTVSEECDKQGATDVPLVLLSSLMKRDLSLHF